MSKKYLEMASCHSCITVDSEEIGGPRTNKRHLMIDTDNYEELESSMDPVRLLPEPFVNEMMGYLSVKELLIAMEVSKRWRNFIKVRSVLLDKTLLHPANDDFAVREIQSFCSEENKRNYKHMITQYVLQKKIKYDVIHPTELYAPTLETLIVDSLQDVFWNDLDGRDDWEEFTSENKYVISHQPCVFPKLRKLIFSLNIPFEFFEKCEFPVLTHLAIRKDLYNLYVFSQSHSTDNIRKFLSLFPKLEVLLIDKLDNDESLALAAPVHQTLNRALPMIKVIRTDEYLPELMRDWHSSLEEVFIGWLHEDGACNLLANFKTLKCLSATQLVYSDKAERIEFVQNDSIEVVKLFNVLEGPYCDDASPLVIENFLLALPSLRELVLSEGTLTADILKLLGR